MRKNLPKQLFALSCAGLLAASVHAAQVLGPDDDEPDLVPSGKGWGERATPTPGYVTHGNNGNANGQAKPGGGGGGANGINYHGGPVMLGTTNVYYIWYGNWGSNTATTILTDLASNIGGSPYFNINTTYYDANGARVLNAVQYTSFWSTGSSVAGPSSSPTDQDMINLIQAGINQNKIAYDPNTVYAIFTGSGVNLGGGFGSQYCAYHTRGTTSQGVAYFAAMPYNQQYPSGCTSALASPNADVAGNSEVNTLAHEIEETTTDARGNAWYDNRGYENADKCAWIWGTTQTAANGGKYNMQFSDGKFYIIQQNWVNDGSGGCATSY